MNTLLKPLLLSFLFICFHQTIKAQNSVYDIFVKVYSDDILEKIEKPTYRIHFLSDNYYVLEEYKNHKIIERGQWKKETNKYFLKKRVRYSSSYSKQENTEIALTKNMKIICNELYDCKGFKESYWKKVN